MAAPRPLARPLALIAAIAAAGSLAYAAVTRASGAPIDAMPAASYLVATIDVAALRASPLYAKVFDKEKTFGLADLALACGFDPMSRIEELDVAIPEAGQAGDFGVAASAQVTREELVRCAENVASARGEARETQAIGRFQLLEDDKGHALAVRDNGTILVGKGGWIRTMIAASESETPSLRANREHMALRDALVPQGTRPLLVATALLPKDLRDRIKRDMGAELGEGAGAIMAGVLGVSAAGIALRITGEGRLEARAELRCESGEACSEVKKLILAKRLSWSQDLGLRIVGFGPPIDALEVETHGASLTATTNAGAGELAAAIDRAQKLRNGRGREREKPEYQPGERLPRPPPAPDEVLRPKGDAGTAP
jgi:hypothetical protein